MHVFSALFNAICSANSLPSLSNWFEQLLFFSVLTVLVSWHYLSLGSGMHLFLFCGARCSWKQTPKTNAPWSRSIIACSCATTPASSRVQLDLVCVLYMCITSRIEYTCSSTQIQLRVAVTVREWMLIVCIGLQR